MARKVVVPYEHRHDDFQAIYLAHAAASITPAPAEYVPAYRDIVAGRRVVWAMLDVEVRGYVWIRDRDGERRTRVRV